MAVDDKTIFQLYNDKVVKWIGQGVKWFSAIIVVAANKYSATSLVGFLIFLFFVLWAVNRDWRNPDDPDRCFDEIDKQMEELERMVEAFKAENEGMRTGGGDGEGGKEEEEGGGGTDGDGEVRRRRNRKKKS